MHGNARRAVGYLENHPSAIFQAATLSDSDDMVESTTMATMDIDKPRPQQNCIALMKTAAGLSKL